MNKLFRAGFLRLINVFTKYDSWKQSCTPSEESQPHGAIIVYPKADQRSTYDYAVDHFQLLIDQMGMINQFSISQFS